MRTATIGAVLALRIRSSVATVASRSTMVGRTGSGEPLQFGAELADRTAKYYRLRQAAPLAPVYGR